MDREELRKYHKKYYQDHKKRIKERSKKYYQDHGQTQEQKEYCKIYYQEHREQASKYYQKYRKNPKKIQRHNEYNKKYHLEHKDKYREYKYGLSPDNYKELLKKQKTQCIICRQSFTEINVPCVDHDHNTGKIRGLLCRECNKLLGIAKDNSAILNNAVHYLENKKEKET